MWVTSMPAMCHLSMQRQCQGDKVTGQQSVRLGHAGVQSEVTVIFHERQPVNRP